MPDEESPVPGDVLKSAKDQLDQEEISLADNEEVLHALSELTPAYENDRSYFVLGNYDRDPIRRLNLVVNCLGVKPRGFFLRLSVTLPRHSRSGDLQRVTGSQSGGPHAPMPLVAPAGIPAGS
ncbi:hypothetical protein SAMN06266787_11339 [Halorubrum ezzemoulense]|uniref:Uncharacterized protein n=1 Tax=Halorubrum ezzemoulense TaxID=337243 RepID=A0A238YJE5_HALEZ|nr:hypothetical protein SAMN06266787_11339 [Halorubrum ezzemoulense]